MKKYEPTLVQASMGKESSTLIKNGGIFRAAEKIPVGRCGIIPLIKRSASVLVKSSVHLINH